MTIDIGKVFDFANHFFSISVIKWYGFRDNYIKWIWTLLKDQESCLLNGGKTSRYYNLERNTQQGSPISACVIIIVLEIVFTLIKTNSNIEGLNIFNHNSLYTAYTNDTTFVMTNINSA